MLLLTQGKQRGVLIPVLMESTELPLGFGELQCIDLRRWRGSTRDVFYRDLTAVIDARLAGAPVPAPKGPRRRAMKALGLGGLPLAALSMAFLLNLGAVQNKSCSISVGQPLLADACGWLGWGDKPSRQARLDWQALPAGDCQALLSFRQKHETSPLRALADSRYAARQQRERETWLADTRELRLFVSQDGSSATDLSAAQLGALARARPEAESLCQGFAATANFRFKAATPNIEEWQCSEYASGHLCGGRGTAACELEVRKVVVEEHC